VIDATQIDAAADLLWDHWNGGRRLAALPGVLRPSTRQEGYAIQARLERRTAFPLFGWKIAATSTAGQKHIGVDGPLAGRLLRERAFTTGDMVPFGRNHMRVAEAEFAFRMGVELPPRTSPYSTDEVRDAIDTLHPSIEIPDSRYDDFTTVGAPQLIADNACGHYFILGPCASDDWRTIDLAAHRVVGATYSSGADLTRSAPRSTRDGIGANVLGDPLIALAWLVNELSALGVPLRPGQVITTGTCLTPLDIAPGDHVVMDFGTLGRVEARMAADA
jgi:2-keto-4-pentenoate hydratase